MVTEISFDENAVPKDSDVYILFAPDRSDRILFEWDGNHARFPDVGVFEIVEPSYIAVLDNRPVWAAYLSEYPEHITSLELSDNSKAHDAVQLDTLQAGQLFFIKLRKGFELLGEGLYMVACRASIIAYWRKRTRFCGACGHGLQVARKELAMVCSHCNEHYYPHVSPAIIVAIRRNERILLVKSKRSLSSFYGLVAGYVEAGETLEHAVHREVKEETNLEIKNLKYVESQAWPFPNSQMVAFTADYKSGEIRIQESELLDAQWFRADEIPPMPPRLSIASLLLEDFLREMK